MRFILFLLLVACIPLAGLAATRTDVVALRDTALLRRAALPADTAMATTDTVLWRTISGVLRRPAEQVIRYGPKRRLFANAVVYCKNNPAYKTVTDAKGRFTLRVPANLQDTIQIKTEAYRYYSYKHTGTPLTTFRQGVRHRLLVSIRILRLICPGF